MYQLLNKAITEFHCYPVCLCCFSWLDPTPLPLLSVLVSPAVRGELFPVEGDTCERCPCGRAGAAWAGVPVSPGRGCLKALQSWLPQKCQKETSSFDRVESKGQVCCKTGENCRQELPPNKGERWALPPRVSSALHQHVLRAQHKVNP